MLMTLYPAGAGKDALRFLRENYPSSPEELGVLGVYWTAPDGDPVPEQYRGQPVFVFLGAYVGPVEEGAEVLKPYRQVVEPIVDLSEVMPFPEVQQALDEDYPDGRNYYWKSVYLRELSDEALEILDRYAQSRPSLLSSIDIWGLGGAASRVPVDHTAFHERNAPYMIGIEANWDDANDNDANVKWARAVCDELMQLADSSTYLNFPGFGEEGEEMLVRAYGKNFPRLKEIKTKYDPDNFFRGASNIKPNSSS
jgi:hypothetical protein